MSDEARYLYCIAGESAEVQLGGIGIEEEMVYTIPHRDVAAVVHSCPPAPYDTKDDSLAGEWILEHNYVIDQAMKRFGTVLPFSFDVIIKGGDDAVRGWLDLNYDRLLNELKRFEDRAEYSVQIFYIYDKFASFSGCSQELKGLKEKIDKKAWGRAYLLQRNLDLKVKDAVSAEADRLAEQFSLQIRSIADDVKTEEKRSWIPEKYRDKKLMASFSCLVHRDKVDRLGQALDEINNLDGLAVRFAGPWAPFSFVDIGGA